MTNIHKSNSEGLRFSATVFCDFDRWAAEDAVFRWSVPLPRIEAPRSLDRLPAPLRDHGRTLHATADEAGAVELRNPSMLLWKWGVKNAAEELFVFSNGRNLYVPDDCWLPNFPCFKVAPHGLDVDLGAHEPERRHFSGRKFFFLNGRTHFGHWLGDFLPNLFFLRQRPELRDCVLVTTRLSGWQRETLRLLRVENEVLELDCGGSAALFTFDSLIVPGPLPPSVRFAFLREGFSESSGTEDPIPPAGPRKLYASRHAFDGERPRVRNDREIAAALEEDGFVTVYPETLGIANSIRLFRAADIVVCAPGSAHFNYFAFARPDCELVTLLAEGAYYDCPYDIMVGGWTYHLPFLDRTSIVLGRMGREASALHAFDTPASYDVARIRAAVAVAAARQQEERTTGRMPDATEGSLATLLPPDRKPRRAASGERGADSANAALLGMLAHAPRRVLEIGRAPGANGAEIKRRFPDADVVGMKPDRIGPEAVGFDAHGIVPRSIDTLILADALEHAPAPGKALSWLKTCLTPDAQVLAVVPNVRFLGVLKDLMDGEWGGACDDALDSGARSFFTRGSVERLFAETGFAITRLEVIMDPAFHHFFTKASREGETEIVLSKFSIHKVSRLEAAEFAASRFLLLAKPLPLQEETGAPPV